MRNRESERFPLSHMDCRRLALGPVCALRRAVPIQSTVSELIPTVVLGAKESTR